MYLFMIKLEYISKLDIYCIINSSSSPKKCSGLFQHNKKQHGAQIFIKNLPSIFFHAKKKTNQNLKFHKFQIINRHEHPTNRICDFPRAQEQRQLYM